MIAIQNRQQLHLYCRKFYTYISVISAINQEQMACATFLLLYKFNKRIDSLSLFLFQLQIKTFNFFFSLRKNPVHFGEYCHPGDPDYRSGSDEDEDGDDKPECEYGTGCYR